ncbi:MAG: SLC13 family permease [Acidisphaera sp.]|nr:SLC13 family permease [Acidisphaera sp.]
MIPGAIPHEAVAFAIIGLMLLGFMWGRVRYDVIAGIALLAGVLTGVVPGDRAFSGFSNPVIIIIASVLVISRAIALSGIVESTLNRLIPRLPHAGQQIGVLTACVTALSAFMKNVGALGIFLPIAVRAAQRSERSPSYYLMPLAFGSLIGGTITEIGTSPNLLISAVRQQVLGHPYALFDFAPVGLPLSILAVVFLSFGYRLLPGGRRGSAGAAFKIENYLTEVLLPDDSPLVDKTVRDLEALAQQEVAVVGIVRDGGRRYIPSGHWTIFRGDVLVLRADPAVLGELVERAKLELVGATELARPEQGDEPPRTVEAIVTPDSALVGTSARRMHLRQRYEVNLLAVRRAGRQIATRLNQTVFQPGDVVVLQGWERAVPEMLSSLGLLPLADRDLALGRRRRRLLPLAILVGAMALVAAGLVRVEVGFFGAAVLMVLLRLLSAREAYDSIDWPVIVMLSCLLPVGEALKLTGGTDLIAHGLTAVGAAMPPLLAVGAVLVAALLLTPLMHHAAAVVVLGPVAADVARNLGFAMDPFLMAVALGASCDFLTPIGHQNNILVMGPGGYRFGDYWRLGLPLSCLVVLVGTPLIVLVWPLH